MSRARRHRHATVAVAARPSPGFRARNVRHSTPGHGKLSGSVLLAGMAALILIVAAVAAILLSQASGNGLAAGPVQRPDVVAPTITGGRLPVFTGMPADPAVGLPIPKAVGTSFDGTPVRIDVDGRPKILLFLAHWCSYCQAEVPVVQRWLAAAGLPSGIDLISVATSIDPTRPNYPPEAWLRREGWTPPVLVDTEAAVAAQYGLGAFPYWVLVAADGTVAERLTGALTEGQLDALATSLVP